MIINSFICPEKSISGDCVKRLDERVFPFQIIANFIFAWYYLHKIDKTKWRILLLHIFLTSIIYFVAGTIHSISKAGLF
jgi:hypothetical protein